MGSDTQKIRTQHEVSLKRVVTANSDFSGGFQFCISTKNKLIFYTINVNSVYSSKSLIRFTVISNALQYVLIGVFFTKGKIGFLLSIFCY